MNPADRERADELFESLVDLPRPSQLAALERLDPADQPLAAEVLSLLDAYHSRDPLLDSGPELLAPTLLDDPATPPGVPAILGRYRILNQLGHGGMGTVYLAERTDVGGRVAIKFLRDPWGPESRWNRFLNEQQTLAGLTHRHIAQFHDAGVHDGTPWFAMEYVPGQPITKHCGHHSCPLAQRLRLFRDVCEGVAYAHQRLTVHLDLKPSNILVTDAGEVKLVDFGIAKHLSESNQPAGLTTAPARLLSLNYAAPEQLHGDTAGTETDVHALGVILYELLTGSVPADLATATPSEFLQASVAPPPKPSASAQKAVTASAGEWADLDVLCLTAMHRDRARRYGSAAQLLRDVNRFLDHLPLEARPDTPGYRARKFIQRNRVPVIASALAAAAVLSILVWFTAQLVVARDNALAAQARAEQIQQLLQNLFTGDEAAGPSESLRVTDLLSRGVQEAAHLQDQPALQADLESVLGDLYLKLGDPVRASALLISAHERRERLLGSRHPDSIRALLAVAQLKHAQGDPESAARLALQAQTTLDTAPDAPDTLRAQALAVLGKIRSVDGSFEQAIPLLEQAIRIYERHPLGPPMSSALGDLGNAYYYLERLDQSEAANLRGLALDRSLHGAGHPNVATDLFNLANIRLDRGDYSQALAGFEEALDITDKWYGPRHPKGASIAVMVGRTQQYLGRHREAAAMYDRAGSVYSSPADPDPVRHGQLLSLRGTLALEQRRLEEAERLLTRAANAFERFGVDHPFYLVQRSHLGAVALESGRLDHALAILQPTAASLESKAGPSSRYTLLTQVRFARCLALRGDTARAATILRAAVAAYDRTGAGRTSEAAAARRALRLVGGAVQRQ